MMWTIIQTQCSRAWKQIHLFDENCRFCSQRKVGRWSFCVSLLVNFMFTRYFMTNRYYSLSIRFPFLNYDNVFRSASVGDLWQNLWVYLFFIANYWGLLLRAIAKQIYFWCQCNVYVCCLFSHVFILFITKSKTWYWPWK